MSDFVVFVQYIQSFYEGGVGNHDPHPIKHRLHLDSLICSKQTHPGGALIMHHHIKVLELSHIHHKTHGQSVKIISWQLVRFDGSNDLLHKSFIIYPQGCYGHQQSDNLLTCK